jgi:hypothetical protein
LILGVLAALKHVEVHPPALVRPLAATFLFGAGLFVMTHDLRLSRSQGAILLALGSAYFVYDFCRHWKDTDPRDVAEATAIEGETPGTGGSRAGGAPPPSS